MELPLFNQPRPGSKRSTWGDKCVHFNGLNLSDKNHKCRAGVVVSSVTKLVGYRYQYDGKGAIYTSNHSMPCLRESDPTNVCSCSERLMPTEKQIKLHESEVAESFTRIMIARMAIIEKEGKKRGVTGHIKCPVCKVGKLRYSIAEINGHIHAGCTTKGCVRWME
jgi:hypothetical protein